MTLERPKLQFHTVNNVNVIEIPGIIQSRARDFVFKPHGDIEAADTVVLTREQYRSLQHDKRNAFEAFKTLMASRPVLFVGFGLRDPDFLLVKDTLAAVYLGAAQDHYALMPDVDGREVDYWRRNYGIHLISYESNRGSSAPAEQHAALIATLDALVVKGRASSSLPTGTLGSDAMGGAPDATRMSAATEDGATLAILRHARRIAQFGSGRDVEILPLAASPYPRRGAAVPSWETRLPFVNGDAVEGLQENRTTLLLTGAPGAGKTFVVRAAASRLARTVIDEHLENTGNRQTPVPVYIDLRDYSGELWKMVVETFPVGFPLEKLIDEGLIAFFIDGLNEVSARIVEDNTLSNELMELVNRVKPCSAVLVTRFGEEHADLELPEIGLESIPRAYIRRRLEERGADASVVSEPFLNLLERPVFFRFCVEHELWGSTTPHAIYTAMLERASTRVKESFGGIDLFAVFGPVAAAAVESGNLLIPMPTLLHRLGQTGLSKTQGRQLIDWLLSEEILIPRLGEAVTFFHHSITEYLAAYDLAARFRVNHGELVGVLRGRRWDQVMLLAIGFLDIEERSDFFEAVMDGDAELCLRALAFLDQDWEQWTGRALRRLKALKASWMETMNTTETIASIRIADEHEPVLLELAEEPDRLGGTALAKTVDLGGEFRVHRAIDDLFERSYDDFNRASAIADGLKDVMDVDSLRYLLLRLKEHPLEEETLVEMEAEEDSVADALIDAVGSLLGEVELGVLRAEIEPLTAAPRLVQICVLDRLWNDGSREALEMTAKMLHTIPDRASVALHFQIAHRLDFPDLTDLRPNEHGPLLRSVEERRRNGWALDTLRLLARYSSEWLDWVRAEAYKKPGGINGGLLWLAAQREDRFFAALEGLLSAQPEWDAEPVDALSQATVDWRQRRQLFQALLRERHGQLAYALVESLQSTATFASSLPPEEVGWWLDWICEPKDGHAFFVNDRLGQFVAGAATREALKLLVELLATGSAEQKRTLAYYVLGRVPGLRLEDLPSCATTWLIDDLAKRSDDDHILEDSVLARVATEEFIEDDLLPRLENAEEPLRSNLLIVIRQAGERHRRRYLTASGERLP